jgi:hypothetical protein
VEGDGREAHALLTGLGLDADSFTPDELREYAASYLWCWGQPLCDQSVQGARLLSALTRGCSAPGGLAYQLVRHEQCEEGDCEIIAPKRVA